MTRWIGLACVLILLTGATTLLYQMLPDPAPEPTIELHRRDDGPPPKLELDGPKVHNFGEMAANTKGSHTWQFKNIGQGLLEVWLENTSCSCTVAELKTVEGEPKKKVTIPPGTVEGTHQHIGSEELYYIFEGEGVAYMGDGDDPSLNDDAKYPRRTVDIFGLAKHDVREVKVRAGSVIYTKSGGIHGIRNPHGSQPLRFVAFGYHSS